jgi:hypothetical protein
MCPIISACFQPSVLHLLCLRLLVASTCPTVRHLFIVRFGGRRLLSRRLKIQLLDDLSGIHLTSFSMRISNAPTTSGTSRRVQPHTHNRDYVNDTAVAFPELGRTSTEVKQSQVILTFIQAMKVCDAILHSIPNSKSIVPQVPGFCLPRFTKLASDLILANPARESTSFFKCKFAESDMACPYDHILLDGH